MQRRRLQPLWANELAALPPRDPLIEDFIDRLAFSLLYGPSGCAKSFFAIDLMCHVALGWPWRDRETTQGSVLFIAAEGGLGIRERILAWCLFHKIDIAALPVAVLPTQIDLCRSASDPKDLLAEIQKLPAPATGGSAQFELVIIDTVSQALCGADENSTGDMGSFITNCNELRQQLRSHIMGIHHTGKDQARGARGSSTLKAAVDTEVQMYELDNWRGRAYIAKQRDRESGLGMGFKLHVIPVGVDKKGKPITSCVVEPAEFKAANGKQKFSQPALDILEALLQKHGYEANGHVVVATSAWRAACEQAGVLGTTNIWQAFKRIAKGLVDANKITGAEIGNIEVVWLAD